MEKYKNLFIYLIIICIQILVVIGAGLWELFFNGVTTIAEALSEFKFNIGRVELFVLFSLFSFVPVFISGKNLPWRHFWVWIIPAVFFVPVPYLFYYINTCTGKMCGLAELGFLLFILGIEFVYIVCYLVAHFLRKWDISVAILKGFLVLYTAISLYIFVYSIYIYYGSH